MLTRKQHELLLFINERLRQGGVSPSFDEMKVALGLRSKSGIHRLITGLAERGFIRRLAHRARALEVIRLPESAASPEPTAASAPGAVLGTNVIRGKFQPQPAASAAGAEAPGAVRLALFGKIAAGAPVEALSDPSQAIDVPASLLGRGEHFALAVEGDSMIDAGIYNGDTAIIQRADTADNGAIVVAVVDDNEVTLKRLRRKRDSVALEPANPAYETRIFGPDRVKVQGKLIGLYRRY